jgi:1-aminocyclopropane-1-carboxylate deaminase/D-cysteine desulfhydrase-like pyridoxal-dependent ACC family enzyme
VSAERAIFRRWRRLADRVAWEPLTDGLPTPVQPLPGIGAEAWIKRDDLTSSLYGGNKVRKLGFVLGEARRGGATRLITAGGEGSHHVLATALHAARLGMRVTAVLFPQPPAAHVEEVLARIRATGARIRAVARMELVPAGVLRARWEHRHERLCVVPPGGSSAYGTLGYVDAALELAEQVAGGACPAPERVHVAAGTLGTAAGLALGFTLGGLPTRVLTTRITSPLVTRRRVGAALLRGAAGLLEGAGVPADARAALARLEIGGGQIGRGYGHPTPAGESAAGLLAGSGLRLEATYSAKAAAAFLADERPGVRLFWHTYSAVPGGGGEE